MYVFDREERKNIPLKITSNPSYLPMIYLKTTNQRVAVAEYVSSDDLKYYPFLLYKTTGCLTQASHLGH